MSSVMEFVKVCCTPRLTVLDINLAAANRFPDGEKMELKMKEASVKR